MGTEITPVAGVPRATVDRHRPPADEASARASGPPPSREDTMTSTRPSRTSRSTTVAPEGSSTRSFRGDIQGLRALAVVAVILDHLLAWPSGGFLGVDVFFVISGFIITSLLLRQHDKRGRISFAEFYRKRVKRILPASTAVLLVTVVASWMVFLSGRA